MAALVMNGMLRAVARKPCFLLSVRLQTTLPPSSQISAAALTAQLNSSSSFTSNTSGAETVTTGDGVKTQGPSTLPPLKFSVTPTGALFDTHDFVVKLKAAGRACTPPLFVPQ